MDSLTTRQAVPLTEDERTSLRRAAQSSGVTVGIYARALIQWARAHISTTSLDAALDAEQRDAAARRTQASRVGVAHRWPGRVPESSATTKGVTD